MMLLPGDKTASIRSNSRQAYQRHRRPYRMRVSALEELLRRPKRTWLEVPRSSP